MAEQDEKDAQQSDTVPPAAVGPNTDGNGAHDQEAAAAASDGGDAAETGLQSKPEETEGVAPPEEVPEGEVTSPQDPGAAPGEGAAAELPEKDHSEEGGEAPPDTPKAEASQHTPAETEASVVATETEVAEGAGSEEEAPSTDAVTEQASAKGSSEETATAPEGETASSASGSERSGETSAARPSSAGSRGSLTRLVERSSLEQQYRALLLLRRQLMTRSQRVQQRLSQHFSRKTDDAGERVEKNVGELEARYARYLSGIREQQRFTAEEQERRQQELVAFRAQVERQTALVAEAYSAAVELRRQAALKSRSSRTGRLMAAAEVEALISREQQRELELQEARLECLRRETRLSRLEQTLRESEELAGGIHLIDFEQLKIENQTYAEKIEERNEDLTKLRRKISSTVQILTHLKERIQFEQAENGRRQDHLQTVSSEVTHGRESLAQLKQRRDQVRSRTASQRATAGLLGHEALLRDFEARVDEEARLVRELQALKREYADHQRQTQEIRQTVRARRQKTADKR